MRVKFIHPEGTEDKVFKGLPINIGRNADNDLVLEGESISDFHARIISEGDKCYIEDLDTENQTLLNGKPTYYERLEEADQVTIGPVTFEITFEPAKDADESTPVEFEGEESTDVTETGETPKEMLKEGDEPTPTRTALAYLSLKEMDREVRRKELYEDEFLIGRDDSCHLELPDKTVSGRHARIRYQDGNFIVEDLRSSNGTYVNSIKVTYRELNHGDVITVGRFDLDFLLVGGPKHVLDEDQTDPGAVDSEFTHVEGEDMDIFAKLVIISEYGFGKEYVLSKPEMSIGRDRNCDITVEDEAISRIHAYVQREEDGTYTIIDQDSLNGTEVNDDPISRITLKHNDEVKIGDFYFQFIEPGMVYSLEKKIIEKEEKRDNKLRKMLTFTVVVVVIFFVVWFGVGLLLKPPQGVNPTVNIPKTSQSGDSLYELRNRMKEYMDAHKWVDAISTGQKYLELDEGNLEIEDLVAYCKKMMQHQDILEEGKLLQAQRDCQAAIAKFQEITNDSIYFMVAENNIKRTKEVCAQSHLDRAKILMEEGNLEEVIAECQRVLEYDPDNEEAKTLRDEADYKLNKPVVVVRKPTGPSPLEKAQVFVQEAMDAYISGDAPSAIRQYEKTLSLGLPSNDDRTEEATRLLPLIKNVNNLSRQVDAAMSAGNEADAYEKAYQLVLVDRKIAPSRNSAFHKKWCNSAAAFFEQRGQQFIKAGKSPEAYDDWEKALKLQSDREIAKAGQKKINKDVKEQFQIGLIYHDSDPAKANTQYKLVMSMVPTYHEYYGKAKRYLKRNVSRGAGVEE